MKSKFNFILNWSDVVYPERNNIVFENRNKTYGAFAIRMLYERNLIFALSFSVLLFGGVLGLQALLKHPIKIITIPVGTPEVYTLPDVPVIQPEIRHHEPLANPPSNPNNKNFIVTTRNSAPDTSNFTPPVNPEKGKGPDTAGSSPSFPENGKGTTTSPIIPDPKPVKWAAVMPSFPGGDTELMKFLGKQLIYPKFPLDNGIQGTVFVTFVVNQDGSLSDIKLLNNVDKFLNEEAVRVVKKMPKWNPGKQNGNPVRVQLNLPVKFKINEYR
jgi:protein TonB